MQIFPTSPQWQHLRFHLQLILANPQIELTRVVKYSQQFDPRYVNHMKIDCVVNVSEMDEDRVGDVREVGWKEVFQAGFVKMENKQDKDKDKDKGKEKVCKFLMYKIAVNDILPISKAMPKPSTSSSSPTPPSPYSSTLQSLTEFPPNIDTIYLSQLKHELNIYSHKYRIKDKSQSILEYQVDFVFKPLQKWDKDTILCQYCEIAKAIYYCPQDREAYCGKCYEELHRSTKKRLHQQKDVSVWNFGALCRFHGRDRLGFYCLDCMELKCEKCLQNDVHKNQKKHTEIMSLPQLQTTLKQKQSTFLTESKQATKNLLQKIQQILQKLTETYQHQKHELQQKFTQKLSKIREEHTNRIIKAMGYHSEVKRKYDQLLWVENFMIYCEEFLLADSCIKMKDSFFWYLEKIAAKEYYGVVIRNIQQIL